MYIDAALAQEIVNRTMAIIGTNINVMDKSGVIIGSGEPERIGQMHDGAILALQHGDTVEISQQSNQSLKGVKPGINLLLQHNHTIIGVVGITGDPDIIRSYAELVKMTSEMLIERSLLIEQLQWDKRHVEEFISAWVNDELAEPALQEWAHRLSIDLSMPRVAIIVEIESHTENQFAHVRKIVDTLERQQHDDLIAVISMDQIVVLSMVNTKNVDHETQLKPTLNKLIQRFSQHLSHHNINDIRISLGQSFPHPKDIPLSYQSAKQVMLLGKRQRPNQTSYVFSDFRIPVLLSPLADNWQSAQLSQSVNKLKQQDKSGQLMKTLQCLFEHQGNLKSCSDSLYIHRNTLRYRLDKIEQITHISPHTFTGLVELYIGLTIY
ncbi:sugar diacid recognition domain-containing protein [Vibrio rumoiensis]|uniref:CdaR family transcriptional regulator n=1 Tax=Vibrio rumoiensis 1S-45 TaxID=1188252 RepID=A0A1E5E3C4_9VIBR|nr:sugar diacid recognition domain-containing protein [Vibrio rumoiensis]OEF25866.1 CdaR family transcriptional regulator [Vibrio rumoiensis 1S-45]